MRSLVVGLLARLRDAEHDPVADRVALLSMLTSTDLPLLIQRLGMEGRPAAEIQPVIDLVAELADSSSDEAELDRRWQLAVDVLEALAGPQPETRRSRPFWKR